MTGFVVQGHIYTIHTHTLGWLCFCCFSSGLLLGSPVWGDGRQSWWHVFGLVSRSDTTEPQPCGIPDPVPTVQCTRTPLSGLSVFPPFLTVRYNQQVDAKRDLERPCTKRLASWPFADIRLERCGGHCVSAINTVDYKKNSKAGTGIHMARFKGVFEISLF